MAKGGEFQVGTLTSGDQYAPRVKAIASGEFVVTWTGPAQSGPGLGIFERRFDAGGVPQAIELQIDRFTGGDQIVPAIAMDHGGDFVVSWEGTVQDGSGFGVFAQRFKASHAADIDGDGVVLPLTDGLLLLRYLFGFRDGTLVTGAVGPGCTRCTAGAIQAYIAARV